MIHTLSLKPKIILIVSLLTVDAWSSQLTQLADLKDSSCKEALSKNVDDENSEIDGSVKKYKNVRIEKSEQTEYLKNEFNKISPSHLRSDRGYIYPHNARDIAVRLVIELEGNVSRAARALGVSQSTVRNWALDYQDRTGEQIINTIKQAEYSDQLKSKVIKEVEKTNGDVLSTSKQFKIHMSTLKRWLVKYELESLVGLKIIDPVSGKLMDFEDKMLVAMIVDEDYEGNVKKAAKDLQYIPQILNVWVRVYEIKTGKRVRKMTTQTYFFSEERAYALDLLRENNGNVLRTAKMLGIPVITLSRMEEAHYKETGERIRNTILRFDDETKAYAIKIVKKHKGNVSVATRQLNKEGINVSEQTVRNWAREHEQKTDESILNTNPNTANRYDDETKAYAIKIVEEHGGNVAAATRQLNKEGISVSEQTVRKWVIKYEQETDKKILNTNPNTANRYDDETKAHVVEMVKRHKGNVKVATRQLNKEGINVSVWTVRRWWNKYKQTTEGKRWWNKHKQTTEINH